MPDLAQMPWFAGRPGRLLVYRVNRRPKYADTLLPAEMPSDVFDHFVRMLAPGYEVVTGRHHQRIWRVGGIRIEGKERMLTARLGWQTKEDEVISQWSEEEMDWLTQTAEPKERKLMPFGFDGDTRLLSVLTDGRSAPATIAAVFEKVLRQNEQELPEPTTDWSVEPVLDRQDFLTWLGTLDVVTSVSFTAKLPNPESGEAFDELYKRLARSHATQHTETMLSKREEGLIEVEQDKDISQAIAMGQQGFATLRGKGKLDGATKSYNQTRAVASESVEELPPSWDDVRGLITEYLRGSLRRFRDSQES